jgi:hypothetical protein
MSRDSVGVASRYGLDGLRIESRWGLDFHTRPDRHWGPPSFLYNRCLVSFLGVKRLGRGVNRLPQSSPEVKERIELYYYSLFGPSLPVIG